MTKPKGLPSLDRGVNEKTLQDSLPPTKELNSKPQRIVLDTSRDANLPAPKRNA